MKTIQEETIEQLQVILAEIEAQAPLPAAGSREARANHQEWMRREIALQALLSKAELIARSTLPVPVMVLLLKISRTAMNLYSERSDDEEKPAVSEENHDDH